MKQLLLLGLGVMGLALVLTPNASAYSKWTFGTGINLGWEGANINCLGLIKGGPGPNCCPGGGGCYSPGLCCSPGGCDSSGCIPPSYVPPIAPMDFSGCGGMPGMCDQGGCCVGYAQPQSQGFGVPQVPQVQTVQTVPQVPGVQMVQTVPQVPAPQQVQPVQPPQTVMPAGYPYVAPVTNATPANGGYPAQDYSAYAVPGNNGYPAPGYGGYPAAGYNGYPYPQQGGYEAPDYWKGH